MNRSTYLLPALALALALAGCESGGTPSQSEAARPSTRPANASTPTLSESAAARTTSASPRSSPKPQSADVVYLALGDSNVYGAAQDCGSCTTYPYLVRKGLEKLTGHTVGLLDGSQHNRLTASGLLVELKTDNWHDSDPMLPVRITDLTPRAAVRAADLITITVSANDIPWYQDPDSCATRYEKTCLTKVQQPFARSLNGVLAEIAKIRAGKKTTVLVTTFYNDLLRGADYDPSVFFSDTQVARGPSQARMFLDTWNADICSVAARHGARCADTYHAINGPAGLTPLSGGYFTAEAGDLNQAGQNTFAEVILKRGLAPSVLKL